MDTIMQTLLPAVPIVAIFLFICAMIIINANGNKRIIHITLVTILTVAVTSLAIAFLNYALVKYESDHKGDTHTEKVITESNGTPAESSSGSAINAAGTQ